ncbi:bifunctional 2-polyprenyl-6-hydroxyphenol methylase/3-demethylubiquinol 3-O-methyltransferase UbiG [Mycobacterium sp. shizuoka-1]|uniref:class I SAM-dependent methyltransferase n=1 Tax=Mycobacterium sp. shizuoka-1 TaxID=2039281 RepID=UPI00130475F7|nr:class I SAM-dependent methyltransferase [Mycobacterium sp. shizuoka-1]
MQIATRDAVLGKYADGTYATVEVACLCGARGGQLVAERDRYGLPSPSVLCLECGVVRTSPRLADDSLSAFYDHEYRPLYTGSVQAQDKFLELQRIRGENINHFLTGVLPAGSRVVDIGCGAGFTLLSFRESGHRVAGCDLGSTFLDAGRSRGLDLRHGDHTSLADLAPFDLVILCHVFEHIADPRKLMDDLKPMLAPGGLVYIELPGLRAIPGSFGDPLRYFQNAHLWNFDLGSLTAVLAGYGYRQVKGDEFIRSVFTPDPTVVPADQGGYDRAVQALSHAEAMRRRSDARRMVSGTLKDVGRKVLGGERASKLKRKLGRV